MRGIVHSWSDMSQALQLVHGAAYGSYIGVSASGKALGPYQLFTLLVLSTLFAAGMITLPGILHRRQYALAARNATMSGLAIVVIVMLSSDAGLNGGIFAAIASSWALLTLVIGIFGTQSEAGFLE